ncbi:hypothetical protein IV203_025137 [Nitzschia inconspicua]|uniref:Uncharacterized protein n=1 Tax=Nitzschia inconspicua TaxID=303405 RepID=A0A9K3PZV0_9STRA|nr:hypothetical protein IV203_025137 [Nitzschia inconspicua]
MASHEVTISRVLNKIESDDPNSPDFENDDSYQVPMNQMHPDNSTVVAFMATSFFWRALLERILPEGQRGLLWFFIMKWADFTYRIDGASASSKVKETLQSQVQRNG